MDASTDRWQAFRATTHFGNLDGLRCLSILAVIWHHGPGYGQSGLAGRGQSGVTLFFAISGFLITTLLLRERERTGRISLRGFYVRRSLRIFPLYYAILALYVVLVAATRAGSDDTRAFFANLPSFLTYTSNWFVGTAGTFAFAWSLATEEQFYATWPVAIRYAGLRAAVMGLACVLGFVIAVNLLGAEADLGDPLWWRIVWSVQMAICWGCLGAVLVHTRPGYVVAARVVGHRWASAVWLAVLLTLLSSSANVDVPVALAAALLVLSCVVREDPAIAPVLRPRAVVHLGTISYGMYLLHGLVYNVMDEAAARLDLGVNPHGFAGFLLAVAGTTAVASLSFRYFEQPFLRLKTRLSR